MSRQKLTMIHLFPEFVALAEDLSDAEFRELFLAVTDYQLCGKTYAGDNRMVCVLFKSAKLQFDRYAEICNKNHANRMQKNNPTESHESQPKSTEENASYETEQNTPPIPYPIPNPNPIPEPNPVNRKRQTASGKSVTETKEYGKPTVDQVQAYCALQGLNIDAERFVRHYDATGWHVRGSPMINWKAMVRSWAQHERPLPRAEPKDDVADYGCDPELMNWEAYHFS